VGVQCLCALAALSPPHRPLIREQAGRCVASLEAELARRVRRGERGGGGKTEVK
jgi:hypothetical protein